MSGQAAAAEFWDVAHVAGVTVEIGEGALDVAQPADRTLGDQHAHTPPDRRIGHHIGLGDQNLVCGSRAAMMPSISSLQRNRLFAEHMLAASAALMAHSACCEVGSGM